MARRARNVWFFPRPRKLWLPVLAVGLMLPSILRDPQKGRLEMLSLAGLTVLTLALVLYVSVYFVGLNRAMTKLAAIPDGKCAYKLSEEKQFHGNHGACLVGPLGGALPR